jgi:hypothetical protein
MAKPTLPRWASSGVTVEPNSAKKDVGWYPGERPPAQVMNWLLLAAYNCLNWLFDLFDDNGGLKRVQTVRNITALKALTPKATGDVCLVWDVATGSLIGLDPVLFRYDANGVGTSDDVNLVTPDAGGGRWVSMFYGRRGQANGIAALNSGGRVDPSQLPVVAWGFVSCGGAGPTINAGSGNFTASYDGDDLLITLATATPGTRVAIHATPTITTAYPGVLLRPSRDSSTVMRVKAVDLFNTNFPTVPTVPTAINLSTEAVGVMFTVFVAY